ncbi:MAG: hypothetical protein ABJA82_04845, partial [Myxococcales bacterium]
MKTPAYSRAASTVSVARAARGAAPYGPAVRLTGVRALLDSATGASVYDIAERFSVSVRTALRYLE